jgi:hypothetical protein
MIHFRMILNFVRFTLKNIFLKNLKNINIRLMHFIHAYIYFYKFKKENFFKVDRNKISFVKENRDNLTLFCSS